MSSGVPTRGTAKLATVERMSSPRSPANSCRLIGVQMIRRRRSRTVALAAAVTEPTAEPDDETSHRIYVNPWADDEDAAQQPAPVRPDPATPYPIPFDHPPSP